MFFNDVRDIHVISRKVGTAIFVVPDDIAVEIPGAYILQPEEKKNITIVQVRNLLTRLYAKQTEDFFVVIRPADAMNEEATNALLKTLEEPRDKVHFVLITSRPSMLIPTVVSRSAIYTLREEWRVDAPIKTDDKVKELAKQLMVAKPSDLASLADKITKKRENVRQFTLDVVSTAIEMSYKTYILTKKKVFLDKTMKFLTVYEAIMKNGHIKLHLVADLC